MDNKQAQLEFLQIVRGLRCEDCVECFVWTGEAFPVDLKKGTELKLVVSCSGLLFLAADPCECVFAVNHTSIKRCGAQDQQVLLLVEQNGREEALLHFETDDGNRILESLRRHRFISQQSSNKGLLSPFVGLYRLARVV